MGKCRRRAKQNGIIRLPTLIQGKTGKKQSKGVAMLILGISDLRAKSDSRIVRGKESKGRSRRHVHYQFKGREIQCVPICRVEHYGTGKED